REPEQLDHLGDVLVVCDLLRDPPGVRQHVVRLGAPRLDEHVADPLVERQIRPPLAVQVADLPPAEPELDAAEAVRVRGDPLPGTDLPLDATGDILHPCRSTSASASCPGSATSSPAT